MPTKDEFVGLFKKLVNTLLVLEFGYSGSPGRFGRFGEGAERAVERHVPADGRLNGSEPFFLRTWVDDGLEAEAFLYRRPYLGIRAYKECVRGLLGDDAINADKLEAEGETSEKTLAWGLEIDTVEDTFSLPDLKFQKAQWLVNQPEFRWGNKRLTRLQVQVLRGNCTYWTIVCPSLKPELASIDRLLGGPAQDSEVIEGIDHEDWVRFRLSMEVIRILVEDVENWRNTFTQKSAGVLSTVERMSMPSEKEKMVWTGGDATKERVAAIDWNAKAFIAEDVDYYYDRLKDKMVGATEDIIIAVAELICFTLLASLRGEGWMNRVVVYVSDNQNVATWINSRYSKVPVVQALLRLLGLVDAKQGFSAVSSYIRTWRNETADDLSREAREETAARLISEGFTRLRDQDA